MSQPIGVLGGIFDPVHNGHLAIAILALEYFNFEKLLFVPAGVPPHKLTSVTASSADRLAMLKIALESCPAADIWENELHRTTVSYTVDTLHEMAVSYPGRELYFIIGADNLYELLTWHNYKEIIRVATLCVAARPGFSLDVPQELSSARIKTFPSPQWGLSSTMIRAYIDSGYSCRYLLPDGVREYIMKYGLYRKIAAGNIADHS